MTFAPLLGLSNLLLKLICLQADVAHWMNKSNDREARLGYQLVSKELETQHVLIQKQMDEGTEDRLKFMEEAFQKEATMISQERAHLKLQQQDLVQILILQTLLIECN